MTNRELLELIAAKVGSMEKEFKDSRKETDEKFQNLEDKIDRIGNTVTKMEHDNKIKFEALFDGHTQNSEKLDRIEKEVSRQEEIILRKVK